MTADHLTALASTATRYVLAEGPQWNAAEQTVSWVDIEGRSLIIAELRGDGALLVREERHVDDRIAFAHPLGSGSYLIGLGRRLAISGTSGVGEISAPLLPAGRRLNDSVIDPAGRVIVGGMSLEGNHAGNALMRVEHDGKITVLDDDLRLSNGLAFSPDGSVFYSVDSLEGIVYARAYDAETGAIGPRRAFARVEFAEPDGIVVDEQGSVWVALWGGAALNRYDTDGRLAATVPVGPQHVTSLEFAGPDLRHVVVTTSMLLLDEAQRAVSAQAGRVLTYSSAVRGRLRTAWNRVPLDRVEGPAARTTTAS